MLDVLQQALICGSKTMIKRSVYPDNDAHAWMPLIIVADAGGRHHEAYRGDNFHASGILLVLGHLSRLVKPNQSGSIMWGSSYSGSQMTRPWKENISKNSFKENYSSTQVLTQNWLTPILISQIQSYSASNIRVLWNSLTLPNLNQRLFDYKA